MLLMKRHLIELVKAGKKRQTVRLWRWARVRVRQLAFVPGLGRVRILAVDELASLRALTRADARADGFATRRAMLEELARLYGTAAEGKKVFRVRFVWPVGRRVKEKKSKSVKGKREALRRYVMERVVKMTNDQ